MWGVTVGGAGGARLGFAVELFEFPAADERGRVGALAALLEPADDVRPGRARQGFELGQALLRRPVELCRQVHPDQQRPLRHAHRAQCFHVAFVGLGAMLAMACLKRSCSWPCDSSRMENRSKLLTRPASREPSTSRTVTGVCSRRSRFRKPPGAPAPARSWGLLAPAPLIPVLYPSFCPPERPPPWRASGRGSRGT